uniref:Uncharacterized protein n=1 Tax=Arundo donax TaxID=35708 RepID=A0A0A9GG94_ARUDO
MNVAVLVNRLYGKHSFCNIKSGFIFCQCVLAHKQSHHVTPRKVLHDEI